MRQLLRRQTGGHVRDAGEPETADASGTRRDDLGYRGHCDSFCADRPAATFVMLENPRQRMPRARAAMTSGTVDMPTASAPSRWSMRISAGVSNEGPSRPA